MCGIAGYVGAADASLLARMTDALAHRGPDGRGLSVGPDGSAHLGHRRLAIIDVESGAQPMWTADRRLGVTFNGEIYNHRELRAQLARLGHEFSSDHCDTEVLLHGYREWGVDLLRRLNGMWAFVIYDREEQVLFGARDRFGKKPLYYSLFKGGFAFASELQALRLHPGVDTRLDRRAIRKYFGYGYIPAPLTMLTGARKLPGGCWFRYAIPDGMFHQDRFWDFALEPDEHVASRSLRDLSDELLALLDAAVARRLMSDVPLGFFLSGGVDSSAVSLLAAKQLGGDRTATFSVGFEDPDFDESAHAEHVAAFGRTRHRTEVLSIDRARALLPSVARHLDEPLGDASILPTYMLCAHARKYVTVALGGDGADELFAGYDPFRAVRLAQLYSRIVPRPVHTAISALAARLPVSHGYMSFDFRLKRTLRGVSHRPALWGPLWMASLSTDELERLFGEKVDLDDVFSEAIEYWDSCASSDYLDRLLVYYTKLYLQDDILTKVDRASMAVSLEVRCPFLDIDVVDFARRLPAALKYRRGQTKFLLKHALRSVLPPQTLRRAKQGFGVPIGRWFKGRELVVTGAHSEESGLDVQFIRELCRQHEANEVDQRAVLWNQWMLEQWLESAQGARPNRAETLQN